jgi:alanine-glyoxylate transaminase / serine-glyoxylate transaminase / serine-pyruvate transaminase
MPVLEALLSIGEKCLVGINGFFGERLTNIAVSNGLEVVPVEAEWGNHCCQQILTMPSGDIRMQAAALVVHLETSTTIVNPIQEIGQHLQTPWCSLYRRCRFISGWHAI